MPQPTTRIVSRRSVLKQLAIITGGVLVLPACMPEKSKSSLLLKNIKVDSDAETLVAELSETILPATDTPGAKDLYTHLFALKMVDDCSSKEEQEIFMRGLNRFGDWSKKTAGVTFSKASAQQRENILQTIEVGNNVPDDIKAFYNQLKGLTVQAYVTSKFYLTEVQPYKLTPGYFKGCTPVQPHNTKAYKV